ncbi:MAG: hypothetical protein WCJ56_03320 [bacterium]
MMQFRLLDGETVIKQGKANRSNFLIAQGGELTLTNKRLIFVGHGINIGEGTISIDLTQLMTFGKAFTFVIFFPIPVPNAIKVITTDGKVYKFTVWGRKDWVAQIQAVLSGQMASPVVPNVQYQESPASSLPSPTAQAYSNANEAVQPQLASQQYAEVPKKAFPWKGVGIGVGIFIALGVIGNLAGGDKDKPQSGQATKQSTNADSTANQQTTNADVPKAAKTEPVSKTVNWNTTDLNFVSNGNMELAIDVLNQQRQTRTLQLTSPDPATVMKAPWRFYGQMIEIKGTVNSVQDYPPNSELTKKFGGGEVNELGLLCSDNETYVDALLLGTSGDIKVGDQVTVKGLPVGQVPMKITTGGEIAGLVLIGDNR